MLIHRIAAQLYTAEGPRVIEEALDAGKDATLAVSQSGRVLMLAAQFARRPRPVVYIVSGEDAAERAARGLAAYVGIEHVARFPEREDYPWVDKQPDDAVVAMRCAALERLGYAPEDFCALASVAGACEEGVVATYAPGDTLPPELFRWALEALDPEAVVLLDDAASAMMREAYAEELAEVEQFNVAMLESRLVARVLGRRVLALGGFEAALASADAKQRMWAYLKQLPPLGSPL